MLGRRPHHPQCTVRTWVALIAAAVIAGCGDSTPPVDPDAPGLEHTALHSGTLVHLGERHDHHLELVLDKQTGDVRLYTLDSTARTSLPPRSKPVSLRVQMPAGLPGDENFDFNVELEPDAENICYTGQSNLLQHAHRFRATVKAIHIENQTYEHVGFEFPLGNEY